MPWKTFYNWLFDGSRNTPIPSPKFDPEGKVLVPDILKYNSPISHTYVISRFTKHGPLNYYLNKYFNNMNLRYLDKEELFYFIKKCVLDFKVTKNDMRYVAYKPKEKLFDKLRERFPHYKNSDITLMAEIIESSEERDAIYQAFGIEVPKKQKVKKQTKLKSKKISLKEFLEENFSVTES